jgi:hypothetical protein
MNEPVTSPRVEDVVSVGTRISWSAILAGTLLALGVYFLLGTLGGAVGLSTSDRMNPTNLQTAAIIWAFLITVAALFVGGLATSLFTVGENKIEAVMSGVIMWALLSALLLLLGAAGVRAGFNAMVGMANAAQSASTQEWETGARAAGVSAEHIEDWRRKQAKTTDNTVLNPADQQALSRAATRISWYVFAGPWLSMLAAAAGACLGAGPTFRIVAVPRRAGGTGSLPQTPVASGYSRM